MMIEFFIGAKYPCKIFTEYDESKVTNDIQDGLVRIAQQGKLIREQLQSNNQPQLIDAYKDLKFIMEDKEDQFHIGYWKRLRDNYFDSKNKNVWGKDKVEDFGRCKISESNYDRYKAIFDRKFFLAYYCMYWVYWRNIIVDYFIESVENTEIDKTERLGMLDQLTAIYNDIDLIIVRESTNEAKRVAAKSSVYEPYETVIVDQIKVYVNYRESSPRARKNLTKITLDSLISMISDAIYEAHNVKKEPAESAVKEWVKKYKKSRLNIF